jgi:hypothetical protein
MAGSLRTARYLQLIGFSIVALAFAGIEILFGTWFDLVTQAQTILAATAVIAFGVFALATWSWFSSLEATPGSGHALARPLRIFSVAYLVTAIGYMAYTFALAHDDILRPYDGRRAVATVVLYGLQFAGFCLVTAAYWRAASELQTPTRSEEPEQLSPIG